MYPRATQEMKEKIFIKTNRIGFIPQLGIQGPIVNPFPTTREVAYSMVVSGIEVFEVTKEKDVIKLTMDNIYGSKELKEEKPAAPKSKVGEPVTPTELKGIQKEEKPVDDKGTAYAPAEPVKAEEPKEKEETKKENNQKNNNKGNNKKNK